MPDLLSKRPKESDGVDNVVVVDGIPIVGSERLEKLKGVLRKIFSKVRFSYFFKKIVWLGLNKEKCFENLFFV